MLIACTSNLSLFSSHLCFDQFIFTLCSLPYVHFHNSIYSSFNISLWPPVHFGLFPAFSVLYVHSPGSVFLSGFRMILDFFPAFLGFMSILNCSVPYCLWFPSDLGLFPCFSLFYIHMEEYRSLRTAKSSKVSKLR